jgi:hypothetical protein
MYSTNVAEGGETFLVKKLGCLGDLRRVEVVVEVEVYELWVGTRKPRERLCIAMAGGGRCICGIDKRDDGFMYEGFWEDTVLRTRSLKLIGHYIEIKRTNEKAAGYLRSNTHI